MKTILHAIDWTSVKLSGVSATPLFIHEVDTTIKALSVLAIVSTIVYNSIRIYKETKNKV